ncbi:MAG: hypothetical protein ABI995_09545 [Acidobacteriota bacterium]
MRLRLRALLLIALLALTANFGVQVSRVGPPRTASAIVFVDESGRTEEHVAEASAARISFHSAATAVFVSTDAPRADDTRHPLLFQRPPPSVFSSRI